MKKSLIALAALSAIAGAAQAQSSVTLYGVIDASVRYSDNAGARNDDNLVRMPGGGLTPSRWGMRVNEDLGGGWAALANIEQRFTVDDGAIQALQPQWAQSFVGIKTPFGQVTMGRQYNMLFDAQVGTYSPAKTLGPFIESYKPEAAMLLGARNNNMVKYSIAIGGFSGELQASAGEGQVFAPAAAGSTVTTDTFNGGGKSYGAMARYVIGPIAVSGAYVEREFDGDRKATGGTVGIGYQTPNLYLNAFYFRNEYDNGLRASGLFPATYLGSGADNNIVTAQHTGAGSGGVKDRDMFSVGGSYLFGSAVTVGGQYWQMKQTAYATGPTPALDANGKVDYHAVFASYAFSKRTNVYAIIDYTKAKEGFLLVSTGAGAGATGPTDRTGFTTGIVHRF